MVVWMDSRGRPQTTPLFLGSPCSVTTLAAALVVWHQPWGWGGRKTTRNHADRMAAGAPTAGYFRVLRLWETGLSGLTQV